MLEDMHGVCHSLSAQHRLPWGDADAHSLSVTCPPFPAGTQGGDPPSAWASAAQVFTFMDQAVAEKFPDDPSAGAEGTARLSGAPHRLIAGDSIQPAIQKHPACSSFGVCMSPSRNLYLSKDEDDVRDTLHAHSMGVKAQRLHVFSYVFIKKNYFRK